MVGTTADLIWGIRNCSAKGSIERRVEIFSYERERKRDMDLNKAWRALDLYTSLLFSTTPCMSPKAIRASQTRAK